jgi:hypothetical protein
MAVIMVEERFDPPIDVTQGSPIYDVRWLSSYIATDGTRCVCVYEADDAEAVRKVYRAANVAFEKVWTASPSHRGRDAEG